MSGNRIISAENVSIAYGDEVIVNEINLDIQPGFTAIFGISGSGKTTFLRGLMGLLPLKTGVVTHYADDGETPLIVHEPERNSRVQRFVNNFRLESGEEHRKALYRSRYTGYIPQIPKIPDNLTLHDYVTLPHAARGNVIDPEYARGITDFLGITEHLHKYSGEISGGQRQRAAIAAALLHRPRFVFADEPTSALDSAQTGKHTLELLRQVSEKGTSVICVAHDPEVIKFADQVVAMEAGDVVDVAPGAVSSGRHSVSPESKIL